MNEPLFQTAFQLWARETGAVHRRLSDAARAFLERRKCFHSYEIKKLTESARIFTKLGRIDGENLDWRLDQSPFRGYKNFGAILSPRHADEEDPGSISTEAILPSDGDPDTRAVPVERDDRSLLFKAMGERTINVDRLYYHERIAEQVTKIL